LPTDDVLGCFPKVYVIPISPGAECTFLPLSTRATQATAPDLDPKQLISDGALFGSSSLTRCYPFCPRWTSPGERCDVFPRYLGFPASIPNLSFSEFLLLSVGFSVKRQAPVLPRPVYPFLFRMCSSPPDFFSPVRNVFSQDNEIPQRPLSPNPYVFNQPLFLYSAFP